MCVVYNRFRPEFQVSKGGSDSDYSTNMYQTYQFPPELKSQKSLTLTAGKVPILALAPQATLSQR